jgi:transcriptional regulator with XRE-family HTH domain
MALVLKELNINQYEFAEQIGIGPNYLSMIINGKRVSISLSLAKLIQEMFGYSSVWLLEGMGEKLIRSRPEPKLQLKPKQKAVRKKLENCIDKMTLRQLEIMNVYAQFVYSQTKKKKYGNT